MAPGAASRRRKQVTLDAAVLAALDALARETGANFDALADEAFRDLLKTSRIPIGLRQALRASTRQDPANDRVPADGSKPRHTRSARKP